MPTDDYREYHQRLASRLRSTAKHSTTRAIKARLIAEAEEYERIASGETEVRVQSSPIGSRPDDQPQEERTRDRHHHRNDSLLLPS